MSFQLRPYQSGSVDAVVQAIREKIRRMLYVQPTGCGKTVTFAAIHRALRLDRPTLKISHREELLDQAARTFRRLNPDAKVGVEQAGRRADLDCNIVCASVQTLSRGKRLDWLNPGLIIIDEAHHAVSDSYMNVLRRFGAFEPDGPIVVGTTATPKRLDRLNLDTVFERQVFNYSLREAIEDGWLVDVRGYRVRTDVSLEKIKTTAGDFNQKELAEAVNSPERTRRALSHWWNVGKDRPTVAFCASVEHAYAVAEEFRLGGFRAGTVHGGLTSDERKAELDRFYAGEYNALTNVDILTEGWDFPPLSCILMMRPTQSWGRYMQMLGRGTRPLNGVIDGLPSPDNRRAAIASSDKPDLIVIDVVDNCRRHSLASVPAVLDLPANLDLEGKSLTMAAKYIEELGEKAAFLYQDPDNLPDTITGLETALEQVDLFAPVEPPAEVLENCDLTWVRISPERYMLDASSKNPNGTRTTREARLSQNLLGSWILQIFVDGELKGGREYGPGAVEPFLRDADRRVQKLWPWIVKLQSQTATWRQDPPSKGQLGLLRRFGYPEEVLKKLTKGSASNLITAAKARTA